MLGIKRQRKPVEFDLLGKELMDSVPDIHSNPRIVAARDILQRLKDDLRTVQNKLNVTMDRGTPSGQHVDVTRDAEELLSGKRYDELGEVSPASARKQLLRAMHALSKAIEIQESKITGLQIDIAREIRRQIEPLLQTETEEHLAVFESLLQSLRKQNQLFSFLGRQGLSTVPTDLRLDELQNQLLFGGSGQASLEIYLDRRRRAAGLKPTKETK